MDRRPRSTRPAAPPLTAIADPLLAATDTAALEDAVARDAMLRHALKSHGLAEKELARGQLPLTVAHFDRFRAITSHPDYVARSPKTHMGNPAIEYTKAFEDARLIYVEQVDERNARVSFVTMRAYPVGKKVRR